MNKSIEIKLDADTNKLSLKLKAIAKHAEALANELDAIDSIEENELGYMKLANEIFLAGLNHNKNK